MAFIPTPNGVKVEFKFNKNGALVVNVVWFYVSFEVTIGDLQGLTTELIDWWNDSVKTLTTPSMSLFEVVATDMSVENGIQWVDGLVTPIAGTAGGADLPSNIAAVVTHLTDKSGRSFRGRTYIAGMSDANVSGNTFATTYVTNLLTAFASLKTRTDTLQFNHSVCSFYSNNVARSAGLLTVVSDYRMDNVVDTQRRRIPKVFN